jgi:hypothetical protein
MPRYVILQHDHPFLHWDLMLETGPVLRSWRLLSPPALNTPIPATALGDHRLVYLDYEGPVSGNRGTVTQWDRGDYEQVEESEQRLVVRLRGLHWVASATLDKVSDSFILIPLRSAEGV